MKKFLYAASAAGGFIVAASFGARAPVQIASTSSRALSTTSPITRAASTTTAPILSAYIFYNVVHVVDGDTIKLNIDGATETVRLIGINAPETVDPKKPVQCFGPEASEELERIVDGRAVRIEKDASQGSAGRGRDRDIYGRLLAYVFLRDGTNINEHMIRQGFAREYTYRGISYTYQQKFKSAQRKAQEEQKGLWMPGVCS